MRQGLVPWMEMEHHFWRESDVKLPQPADAKFYPLKVLFSGLQTRPPCNSTHPDSLTLESHSSRTPQRSTQDINLLKYDFYWTLNSPWFYDLQCPRTGPQEANCFSQPWCNFLTCWQAGTCIDLQSPGSLELPPGVKMGFP